MKCGSLLHGHMGYCYARSGRREEALREIGILNTRSESSYVSPMSFAAIYSGLGEEDEALRYLDRAVEVRDTSLHLRLLSTEFDKLRDHPRFELKLRSRIGLSPRRTHRSQRRLKAPAFPVQIGQADKIAASGWIKLADTG